ncbi:MAG: hypothetical protein P4L81_02790 [Candidatus Pacebacteria bacterium]|nr:hypothetical protein [Candidatus Paceibacterota bacterium]
MAIAPRTASGLKLPISAPSAQLYKANHGQGAKAHASMKQVRRGSSLCAKGMNVSDQLVRDAMFVSMGARIENCFEKTLKQCMFT